MYFKSRVDLEFLWMMLSRFGANPPSLDSAIEKGDSIMIITIHIHEKFGNWHCLSNIILC